MTRWCTRTSMVGPSALVAIVTCVTATPASGLAQPGITVEDPDGGHPGEHFTDLTMVPGDTTSSAIVVSQNTGSAAEIGVRFESSAEPNVLSEQVELTVQGLGEVANGTFSEMLGSESPFWLGILPSGEDADVTVTVHLPIDVTNDTKQTHADFRVIVTAQADLPDEIASQESPSPTPSEIDDPHAPSPSADPSVSPGVDSDSSEDLRLNPDPEEELPRTGTDIILSALVAASLMALGALAVRASRRRT